MVQPPVDTVVEFCARLKQLWLECGRPPLKSLEGPCGKSDSQLSTILNGKIRQPMGWEVVAGVVNACARHAEKHGHAPSLTTSVDYWRREHGRLELLPPSPRLSGSSSAWGTLIEEHAAWKYVPDPDVVRGQAVATAEFLSERYRRTVSELGGDPWSDPAFTARMATRVCGLLAVVDQGRLDLSPVEAALLVLTPLVHQVSLTERASELLHINPIALEPASSPTVERSKYEWFLSGQQQQRLVARAAQRGFADRSAAAGEIGWWLYHRWLETLPGSSSTARKVLDAAPIADRHLKRVLIDTSTKLSRVFRLPPDDIENPDRLGLDATRSLMGLTAAAQQVRERLVGLLLVTAQALAIESLALPATIVEHLGIPDAVDLPQLLEILDTAEWAPTPIGIGLVAECHHEAVLEALREHVVRVDLVLGAVQGVCHNDVTLQPLLRLPARASADQVEPALDDDHPVFTVPVTRFRLDESRVRELLMGEQLYRDQALAVRELYQNALDACRYRRARHEYRVRMSGWRTDWTGRISFTQGVDDLGRYYLRCQDNGVGMGEQELREVFSHVGIRFADRPEFREEQDEWAFEDIRIYPNSRFGIGVMSYFMLADEIEVETCRMDRHGDGASTSLKVIVTGPGHLFRIKRVEGSKPTPGTTVTLYLRDGSAAPSCTDVLERLLGIAEFTTTAEFEGNALRWEPGVFTPRTQPPGETGGIHATGALVPAPTSANGHVIWCEQGGALLVDGIYTHPGPSYGVLRTLDGAPDIRGAVVNLTREWVPRLTVDRSSLLDDASERVGALLADATSALTECDNQLFTARWLRSISAVSPLIADIVTTAAIAVDARLDSGGKMTRASVTGFFPLDHYLIDASAKTSSAELTSKLIDLPEHLLLWRCAVHFDGQLTQGLLNEGVTPRTALPSDELITELDRFIDMGATPGHVAQFAGILGISPRTAARRLEQLGYQVPGGEQFPDNPEVTSIDTVLLSLNLDAKFPWLERRKPVNRGHLEMARKKTKRPHSEIIARLSAYGFDVSYLPAETGHFSRTDAVLISFHSNGKHPWLNCELPVPHWQVYRAAVASGLSVLAVTERLIELGYKVSDLGDRIDWTSEVPRGSVPAVVQGISTAEAVIAAAAWNIAPALAFQRLQDVCIPLRRAGVDLPNELSELELDLICTDHPDSRYLNPAMTVPWKHLIVTGKRWNLPVATIASTLTRLGFTPPKGSTTRDELGDIDLRIIDLADRRKISLDACINTWNALHMTRRLGVSVGEFAIRVHSLGYTLEELSWLPEWPTDAQYNLLTESFSMTEYLASSDTVPLAFVMLVTKDRSSAITEATARELTELGFTLSGKSPSEITGVDFDLLRTSHRMHEIDPSRPVGLAHLLSTSLRTEMPVEAVAEGLRNLGLDVPDVSSLIKRSIPLADETAQD